MKKAVMVLGKIRVLHVLYRLDQGGVENFIMNVYRNIDRTNIEFDFALISGEKSVFDEEINELGGKIYYFSKGKKTKSRIEQNLKRIIDEEGPFQAIHSHCYFFSGYMLGIAKKYGIPIRIAHAHDVYKGQRYTLFRYVYEYVMRFLLQINTTNCLGCSDAAVKFVYGKNNKKVEVIHNAINIEKYRFETEKRSRIRKQYGLEESIVVGHVGRFEDQKDHEYLIDVFSEASKERKDLKLMMIGEGSLIEKEKEHSKNLNIYEKTLFMGNRNNVNELMMAMDIFVFPSKYEGLGIVLVEAQASGLPCIISDCLPEDTKKIGKMTILNKSDKNEWVKMILAHCEDKRSNNELYLKDAGYDIKQVVARLSCIYSGGDK